MLDNALSSLGHPRSKRSSTADRVMPNLSPMRCMPSLLARGSHFCHLRGRQLAGRVIVLILSAHWVAGRFVYRWCRHLIWAYQVAVTSEPI